MISLPTIGFLLLAVVVAGVSIYATNQYLGINDLLKMPMVSVTLGQRGVDFVTLSMFIRDPRTEVTKLKAVDGSISSGTAYRLKKEGKLYYLVVASLPELAEERVYEVWLVQPERSKSISAGLMEKDEKGKWSLEWTRGEGFLSYRQVVITQERKLDDLPETHILEGEFK